MSSCPIARITRNLAAMGDALDEHQRNCGDRVVGVALNPAEHAELSLAELWGLPVLAWDAVAPGGFLLLCDAMGTLIPQLETYEQLLEHWTYSLQPPAPSDDSVAA